MNKMTVLPEALVRIQAEIACAQIEAMAMHTENVRRIMEDLAPAYTEEDFIKVITDHNIGYNDVIEIINNATY